MTANPRWFCRIGRSGLLVWLCFVLVGGPLAAQDADKSLAHDSSDVMLRTPVDDLPAQYRDNPAFQYEQPDTASETEPSFLSAWLERLSEWLAGTDPDDRARLGTIADWTLWIVAIGLVGWFILLAFRMEGSTPWARSPAAWPEEEDDTNPDNPVTYLERAQKAQQNGHLRNAVRWYYRAVLHALHRADLITYTPEKTNRAYMRAVHAHNDGSLAADVSRVAQTFEYAWYGRFDVSEQEVAAVKAAVERVHDRLQPESAPLS